MNIENFVVVRCEQGDILCTDRDDAEMTIACCEIKQARIEHYTFESSWACYLKVIEERNYAPLRNLR